jgi:hypothetical protein
MTCGSIFRHRWSDNSVGQRDSHRRPRRQQWAEPGRGDHAAHNGQRRWRKRHHHRSNRHRSDQRRAGPRCPLRTRRRRPPLGRSRDRHSPGRRGQRLLNGGAGRDTLSGEAGDDSLTGGPPRDTVTGGPARTRFRSGTATGKSQTRWTRMRAARTDLRISRCTFPRRHGTNPARSPLAYFRMAATARLPASAGRAEAPQTKAAPSHCTKGSGLPTPDWRARS